MAPTAARLRSRTRDFAAASIRPREPPALGAGGCSLVGARATSYAAAPAARVGAADEARTSEDRVVCNAGRGGAFRAGSREAHLWPARAHDAKPLCGCRSAILQ